MAGDSSSPDRVILHDQYPFTVVREIENNMAAPPVDQPVVSQDVAANKIILRPDAIAVVATSKKPGVYIGLPYQPSSYRRRRATESATIQTATAAIIGGLVTAILAHWLIGAAWLGAAIALFGATFCATLILAGTPDNKFFLWMWLATIPGMVYCSTVGLQNLPAIAIPHWTHYGYIPLRIFGVLVVSLLVIPLSAVLSLGTKPNWYVAKALFGIISVVFVVAIVKVLLDLVGVVPFIIAVGAAIGLWIWRAIRGRTSSHTVTTHIIHTVSLVEEWWMTTVVQ